MRLAVGMAAIQCICLIGCSFVSSSKVKRVHGKSYKCSDAEALYQWEHFDLINPSICGDNYVWQLAQLTMPDVETILDVGGNMGYSAAMFFGMWSPGHGFNRKSLLQAIESDVASNHVTNIKQTNTVCADGEQADKTFVCMGEYRPQGSLVPCYSRRNLRVISFDGEKSHVDNTRGTVYRAFPFLKPGYVGGNGGPVLDSATTPSWEYVHAAVTSPLVKGNRTVAYFEQRGDEGSSLVMNKPDKVYYGAIEVPVITIDEFLESRHIQHVDVLKIDAEGQDQLVLEGAMFTLRHRGVSMITAECFECTGDSWQATIHKLDVAFGFECYIAGKSELLYKLTNCVNSTFFALPPRPACFDSRKQSFCKYWSGDVIERVDGNLFCAHRERASALNSILDTMSLYRYAQGARGDVFKDRFVGQRGMEYVDPKGSSGADPSLKMKDIHINEETQVAITRDFGRQRGVLTFDSAMKQCGC